MKNLLLIFLGCAVATCLQAQTQTFTSNIDQAGTVKMTVRIQNNIAYVHRTTVPNDATLGSSIFNMAGVEIREGVITVPEDGGIYWIVPFDGSVSEIGIQPSYYCIDCVCVDQGRGVCRIEGRSCFLNTCNGCALLVFPCIKGSQGSPIFTGPFALVKAGQVVSE